MSHPTGYLERYVTKYNAATHLGSLAPAASPPATVFGLKSMLRQARVVNHKSEARPAHATLRRWLC